MKRQFLLSIFFFILISFTINIQAQNYIIGDINFALGMNDYINYSNINRTNSPTHLPYEDIKGSPYIFDDFATGKVKLRDGKTFVGPLRCDLYAGEIEFKTKEGDVFTIINPQTIETVNIENRVFVFRADGKNANSGNYFEVIKEGKYSLLARHTVILKDPVPEKPYVPGKPATFVAKDDVYYILKDESALVEIKNKEDLIGIDKNRSEKTKTFIKENKVKISDKDDLIAIVNFLNEE